MRYFRASINNIETKRRTYTSQHTHTNRKTKKHEIDNATTNNSDTHNLFEQYKGQAKDV